MEEADWLAAIDPQPMLEFIRGRVSDRKLRLFAAGCCRRGQSRLRSQSALAALEALEAYAEGRITREVMDEARAAWHGRFDYPFPIRGTWNAALSYATLSSLPVRAVETAENAVRAARNPERERAVQAGILREIVGLPHQPITIDPTWLTSDVVILANGIDQSRDFDRLPILADAIQDAGCDSELLLAHLRQPKGHLLGCWALDLILDKM